MRGGYSAVGYAAAIKRNVIKSKVVGDDQYTIRGRVLDPMRWSLRTLLPGDPAIIAYWRNDVRDDARQVVPVLGK